MDGAVGSARRLSRSLASPCTPLPTDERIELPMKTAANVARPISFDALEGAGLERALSLGGGGLFFIAWLSSYLRALREGGVDLALAERVVGTSAGSVVGATLCAGRIDRLHTKISLLGKTPRSLSARLLNAEQSPSQTRAAELAFNATDADEATVHAIGYAALGVTSSSARTMKAGMGFLVGTRRWPSRALETTCVDAYSAERCVITADDEVPLLDAVAASCSVPGFAAPQRIGDRLCMDGGMIGTGVHLDRVAGAARALVISLDGAQGLPDAGLTIASGASATERAALEASGTKVLHLSPERAETGSLMAPSSIPVALEMGARQGRAEVGRVRAFWR